MQKQNVRHAVRQIRLDLLGYRGMRGKESEAM